VELERVAQVIEADAMTQLGIQQINDMAPRADSARLFGHAGLTGDFGDFMLRNEIANLAQDVELGTRWFDCFLFHPCRVAGSKHHANAFFHSYGMSVKKEFFFRFD
jgi:hypothetical protein